MSDRDAGPVDNAIDRLDRTLEGDDDDKRVKETLKNPFVRWTFVALIVLLFLIFITYFLSFILKIPLPETKILEVFMQTIVEIMKVLVPD